MALDVQLVALLAGHYLGDFVLQTGNLAQRKSRSPGWLVWHVFLVAIVTWLLLGNPGAWWITAILFALHLLVDGLKLVAGRRVRAWRTGSGRPEPGAGTAASVDHEFRLFVVDQLLHLVVIVGLWASLQLTGAAAGLTNHWSVFWGAAGYVKGLLLLTGIATGVWGAGVVLKYQMAALALELPGIASQGLAQAGKTIGMLERLLVFIFVLAGTPEGVGFVLAAKSVFRIGHLTSREDRDHAEYIMIGTLRSFVYALIVAFTVHWLIGRVL